MSSGVDTPIPPVNGDVDKEEMRCYDCEELIDDCTCCDDCGYSPCECCENCQNAPDDCTCEDDDLEED
jgi:hypothetical protein